MPTVPERVELIIGYVYSPTTRQILNLGQLISSESKTVREIEGMASQIRDLDEAMKRDRGLRDRLSVMIREKLRSVLADPYRYMNDGGERAETPEVPEV